MSFGQQAIGGLMNNPSNDPQYKHKWHSTSNKRRNIKFKNDSTKRPCDRKKVIKKKIIEEDKKENRRKKDTKMLVKLE